jgi:hypothetical protein
MQKIFVTLLIFFTLSVSFGQTAQLPTKRSTPLIWGVCGHPFQAEAYYSYDLVAWKQNINNQLSQLQKIGATYYRIDLYQGLNAQNLYKEISLPSNMPDNTSSSPIAIEAMKYMYQQAYSKGIKLLAVIGSVPDFNTQDNTQVYALAKKQAEYIGKNYGQYFDYYELSNELDIKALTIGDGFDISSYDTGKMKVIAAYLSGLNDGVKLGCESNTARLNLIPKPPKPQTIVNAAGYLHFGFFDALKYSTFKKTSTSLYAPFTDFDIIGWHFYSNQGNIDYVNSSENHLVGTNSLEKLKTIFPYKDIWITEINSTKDDDRLNDSDKDWISKNLITINNFPSVKAVFFYELFNENYIVDDKGNPIIREQHYGMLSCPDNNCKTTIPKPSFYFYKHKIEDYNAQRDLITSWYMDLNCGATGDGDPNGKNYWIDTLFRRNNNDVFGTAKSFLNADQYAYNFVNNSFFNLLGRTTLNDPNSLPYYSNLYKSGHWEEIILQLSTSDEAYVYSNRFIDQGNTPTERYVEYIFSKLLGRNTNGDPNGKTYWVNQLNALGASSQAKRSSFVNTVIRQDEYINKYVRAQFQALLNRDPINGDLAGLNYYVSLMKNGTSQKDVFLKLMTCNEYFKIAIRQNYVIHHSEAASTSPIVPDAAAKIYIYNNSCNLHKRTAKNQLGLNDISEREASKIYIYPNPVGNALNIDSKLSSIYKIQISSIEGRLMKSVEFGGGIMSLELNVENIPSGVYLCTIYNSLGISVQKIMKR